MQLFLDRADAGRRLAEELHRFHGAPNCVVVALPRGGVVVAAEVARILELPLDICVVRKLGVPWHTELAMGAIGGGGAIVLNRDVIERLEITRLEVDRVVASEQKELQRREKLYRQGRPPIPLAGKTVLLVDDGIATGATVEAAIAVLRARKAARIVVCAAVAAPSTLDRLAGEADDAVCVLAPEDLSSIGEWYYDFSQTTDDQVQDLLRQAAVADELHHIAVKGEKP